MTLKKHVRVLLYCQNVNWKCVEQYILKLNKRKWNDTTGKVHTEFKLTDGSSPLYIGIYQQHYSMRKFLPKIVKAKVRN